MLAMPILTITYYLKPISVVGEKLFEKKLQIYIRMLMCHPTNQAFTTQIIATYCKTLIIRVHLIFAKFANSLKSRN